MASTVTFSRKSRKVGAERERAVALPSARPLLRSVHYRASTKRCEIRPPLLDLVQGDVGGDDASSAASTYLTAPSVLTPVAESPEAQQDENAGSEAVSTANCGEPQPAPPRWRRKTAAERQEADRRQHLAEMRAYFEEVDAFDLAVETPPAFKPRNGKDRAAGTERGTPPRQAVGRQLAAAAPTPATVRRQRAMSLGLSRRRSSMAVAWPPHAALASSTKAKQSPLRLSMRAGAEQE